MTNAPVLEVMKVSHAYREDSVLSDVSLSLQKKEILCIVGPSGCGKTTLLRIIAGLVLPNNGEVLLNGRNAASISPHLRNIGFVFQEEAALFPHLTVRQNIEFPFRHGKRKLPQGQDWREAVNEIIISTQLRAHEGRPIHELSGGLKQRVAIARAIVYRPSLMLLDEPLSSLDNMKKRSLITLLRDLRAHSQSAFLYVTHDDREVREIADRVIVMDNGIIHQQGTIEELMAKPSMLTAELFGVPNTAHAGS